MNKDFSIEWGDIKSKVKEGKTDPEKIAIDLAFTAFENSAGNPIDDNSSFTFNFNIPELSDPYAGNPLLEVFNNGRSVIENAKVEFNRQVTSPINAFMTSVNGVKGEIDEALVHATELKEKVDTVLGNIIIQATNFIRDLPNVTDVNDDIMDKVIDLIIDAIKTGEAKLNEKNLMIYSGVFKSGFKFEIPAVLIDADFDITIGPGTS
jgi:hypothetical protein